MSYFTHLECSAPCGAPAYDPRVEQHLCVCGAPLLARYDLERARAWQKHTLAGREPNMWRYRELMPLFEGEAPVTLGEGWSLDLAPEHIASVQAGLRMVTAPGGTAHFGTALEHWEVIGKTGTAQNALSVQGLAPNHAWFAGMAGRPGGEPEIVIAVIVEYGEGGSSMAAPIMSKTADYYLRRKYGIPVDTVQTYLEHLRSGRPAPWYRVRFPPPQPTPGEGQGQGTGL